MICDNGLVSHFSLSGSCAEIDKSKQICESGIIEGSSIVLLEVRHDPESGVTGSCQCQQSYMNQKST